ncbi:MAG: LacI family transcriptional regulator, partial [Anaerolineae bacterium]|nr:LacI family transcriptional regulator [Anaerolineae bacterium]
MKLSRVLLLVVVLLATLALVACGGAAPAAAPANEAAAPQQEEAAAPAQKTYEDLVVGYAQIGAESEWRTANTASIKGEAEKLGVELKFSDAQQKQENQIKAIRSFIAQQV